MKTTWNIETLPKGCFYAAAFNTSQAAINVATDIALLLFPMPLIWKLQICKKQRSESYTELGIKIISADTRHSFSLPCLCYWPRPNIFKYQTARRSHPLQRQERRILAGRRC